MEARKKVDSHECARLRDECEKRMSEWKDDLKLVKLALVGNDMRGGLVSEVAALTAQIADLVKSQNGTERKKIDDEKQMKDSNLRLKIAVISVGCGLLGVLIGHLLDML